MRLNNKVAIVTGGASGIGEACVRRFHDEGAYVVVADMSEQAGDALASALDRATFYKLDVRRGILMQQMMVDIVDKYGRIDILVNNAGIDVESDELADGDEDVWHQIYAVNQQGTMLGMKYALQHMRKQGYGAILNMASAAGLVAFPGRPAYAASKAAVIQLSKVAAIENGEYNIRVNALCPGAVRTPILEAVIARAESPTEKRAAVEAMNPLPGIISVEAIASAALFLVSDEAEFISGAALPVDGGYTAR
ncbi:Dihydroanticapsin 7-dehydrogenase [BD1-7 clade bacterium]|uniref:Dihydroanticapsin 7-dehydrogenase n=1 Tax=BD1-7 clade bacterium TaxID=2029982 RepID=A0A5S9PR30_9GAMM|nr:Dihydroanticapsin 7-dehydrogenase [BD1-7 clade bacterium]